MSFLNDIPGIEKKPAQRQGETMVLQRCGSGVSVKYPLSSYACGRMQWVDKAGNVRTPQEKTKQYPAIGGFTAAGKFYFSINQLGAREDQEPWSRDCHGREVFSLRERFPCFDSEDYLHEKRCYRWWFIREGNTLTRIHVTDGQKGIFVTEDVANLEDRCWEKMQKYGFCCEKK